MVLDLFHGEPELAVLHLLTLRYPELQPQQFGRAGLQTLLRDILPQRVLVEQMYLPEQAASTGFGKIDRATSATASAFTARAGRLGILPCLGQPRCGKAEARASRTWTKIRDTRPRALFKNYCEGRW